MVSLSLFRRKKSSKAKTALPQKHTAAQAKPAAAPAVPGKPLTPQNGVNSRSDPAKVLTELDPSLPSLAAFSVDSTDSVAVTLATSINGNLRPPAINTDQPIFLGPSSPTSRRLNSSLNRQPRASFVRHTRVLSGASTIPGGLNAMFLPLQALRHRQKNIITDLPAELLPVVNLTNAQRLRQYASGTLGVLAEDGAWLTAEATLTGTELLIWVLGHQKPRFLNIQDCYIVPSREPVEGDDELHDLLVMQDFDLNVTSLRFGDTADMHMWLAAMQLSKFEYTSLNEAFTAVVLSLKGPQLSDIYTLLAHKKRFTRFEWCNLRLPQVSNKWIRVFVAIVPGDSKKKGRIELYSSDKIAKKNLILYATDISSVYNVYPEDHHMIDFNLMMKLEGETFVNRLFEYLFSGNAAPSSPKMLSRPSSIASKHSLVPPAPIQGSGSRSRSTSVNSLSSFFNQAPSPGPETAGLTTDSASKSKRFFKKNAINNFVATNYLYLMPDSHPGVAAVEIMLRNFVHIIDAFKLYGRPKHLNSDKKDPESMLFGLPALPHFGYLDISDALDVVSSNFDTARLQNWGQGEWRTCLKQFLSCRQRDSDFKGVGDIYDLFNSVDLDSDEGSLPDPAVSPLPIAANEQSPRKGLISNKLRTSESYDDFQKIMADNVSGTYSAENVNGETLGNPFYFSGTSQEFESSNGYTRSGSSRTLHPIVDLPTPIDDVHGQSYFQKESRIPLQL